MWLNVSVWFQGVNRIFSELSSFRVSDRLETVPTIDNEIHRFAEDSEQTETSEKPFVTSHLENFL